MKQAGGTIRMVNLTGTTRVLEKMNMVPGIFRMEQSILIILGLESLKVYGITLVVDIHQTILE